MLNRSCANAHGHRTAILGRDQLKKVKASRSSHARKVMKIFSFLGWIQDTELLTRVTQGRAETSGLLSTCLEIRSDEPSFSWAGSGLYFFWQLGAMKYLAEQCDLSKVHMTGASGGSLVAVLAACGVSADLILKRAYELSLEFNIWDRPMGLTGIWGGLVEQWLDELLPENAHEMCGGRVTVVVTTLPDMRQVGISDFKDKQDLINACMASCHVPLVLDLKVTRYCRGSECVDGSFPDFFFGNCDLLTRGGSAVVFDYFDDKELKRQGRMDMLQLTSYERILERVEVGYRYAQRLHTEGRLRSFQLTDIQLPSNDGHVREVLSADAANEFLDEQEMTYVSSMTALPAGVAGRRDNEALLAGSNRVLSVTPPPCSMKASTSHDDRVEERREGLYGSFLNQWQSLATAATYRQQQQQQQDGGSHEGAACSSLSSAITCISDATPSSEVSLPCQPPSSPLQDNVVHAGTDGTKMAMGKAAGSDGTMTTGKAAGEILRV
ncbi:hypothetical protein CEUSTIGMA_g8087.t1 [Chlamydomonas eustigma]|uniref:Patatin n=1 Tax=Chlamydomonas eustigma TaxID=1157962 RepID=A0A250XCN8_9CHLO|nr:hypothetical protein CEUSTIGMA_g8087.t1 [Chlamydomonas eustigma]|eukprot:GAX80652.1 hypothetical protein CEUSTIGMA_g8087.t1 [Chlamydomonas eustigma]